MIPGTPLIASGPPLYKDKIYSWYLVIFDHDLADKDFNNTPINCYVPIIRKCMHFDHDELFYMNLHQCKAGTIALYEWNKLLPGSLMINDDFSLPERGSPTTTGDCRVETTQVINRAIQRHKEYKFSGLDKIISLSDKVVMSSTIVGEALEQAIQERIQERMAVGDFITWLVKHKDIINAYGSSQTINVCKRAFQSIYDNDDANGMRQLRKYKEW